MDEDEIVTLREQYNRAGLPIPTYKIIYGRQGDHKPKDYNANPKQVNRDMRNLKRKRCKDFWLWSWCFRWNCKKRGNDIEEIQMNDPYIANDLSGESTTTGHRRSMSKSARRTVGRSFLRNCYYIQVATANSPIGTPQIYTPTTRNM